MAQHKQGYFRQLFLALVGKGGPVGDAAALQSRIASLEMDLREQAGRMERMKKEYAVLDTSKQETAKTAGQDELEKVFKKLTGPLSNLLSLTAMAESGKEIGIKDMVQLIRSLEKTLARLGLETIGQAGEDTSFDVQVHQRMSGGTVHNGSPVTVQIPGYRMGDKVLLKAMVSSNEEK